MNEKEQRLDELEAFLIDNEGQAKDDAIADLRLQGVDTTAFFSRVKRVVQQGYASQLRHAAEREQRARSAMPEFLKNLETMSREAMLLVFEHIRQGNYGIGYRDAALARCRNKSTSELSDDELRSWLEDVGDVLGEPDKQ